MREHRVVAAMRAAAAESRRVGREGARERLAHLAAEEHERCSPLSEAPGGAPLGVDGVQIEEFYDTMGEGHVGVKADEKSVTLGAGGSGRRVTRRVYRFKGYQAKAVETIEQDATRSR